MRVYIGSDAAGYLMKSSLKEFLERHEIEYIDLGVFSQDDTEYQDIAREVGEKVIENEDAVGVLTCESGEGMAIEANKLTGIRAVHAESPDAARRARIDNETNILTIGSHATEPDSGKKIMEAFLNAVESGGPVKEDIVNDHIHLGEEDASS